MIRCSARLHDQSRCNQRHVRSRKYCTDYHNKFQIIHEEREKALQIHLDESDPDKVLAGVFVEIGKQYLKGARTLKPTEVPRAPINPPYKKQTLSRFVGSEPTANTNGSGLARFLPMLVAMLEAPIDGCDGPKIRDQKERAFRLAQALTAQHTHVRLMDGHGAFLILFLLEVKKQHGAQRLNTLKIELVDLDTTVDSYHSALFMHPHIVCICENVMKRDHGALVAPPATTLVYLNFCGMAASYTDVKQYLRLCLRNKRSIFISMSISRAAAVKNYVNGLRAVARQMRPRVEDMQFEKIAGGRRDFKTIAWLPVPDIPVQPVAYLNYVDNRTDETVEVETRGGGWYRIRRPNQEQIRVRMTRANFNARYQLAP